MDRVMDEAAAGASNDAATWLCRNCGTFNDESLTHCDGCGFVKGYDPDSVAAVQRPAMPALFIPRDEVPGRIVFYMQLIQLLAVLAIAALAIPLLLRLQANWPFQLPYERDALELADRLMAINAGVELGISKSEYDELLAPLLGESARFQGMYGAQPERQRDSYQKLVQAAEFYGFASKSWATDLEERRTPLAAMADAPSGSAAQGVKDYWNRAKSSALGALADLH